MFFPLDLTTALVAFLVILLIYFGFKRHDPSYPPCPRKPLPIVGHIPYLEADPRKQMASWRKQCGDVFSLYMLGTMAVVLNGYDTIKEAFVKRGNDFSDRAVNFMDVAFGGVGKGIEASSGAVWKENRTASLLILRTFGMGKNALAVKIEEEVSFYIKQLKSLNGQPTDINKLTNISVSNVMCSIIVGKRFDYNDKQFNRMLDILNVNLSLMRGTILLNFCPSLRHLPGDFFNAKIIQKNFKELKLIFNSWYLNECKADREDEPTNFIGAYLREMHQKKEAGTEKNEIHLDEENLMKCIFDLFAAGTETTTTTIVWCLLYILNHPPIQRKIFSEIEEVVGLERTPCMQDKPRLIYLSAVIMETQRITSILSLGFPRLLPRTVQFKGFTIPKGTLIIPNNDSVLLDKNTWGDDVDEFKPERFIGKDGNLLRPDEWIPFSNGRRVCLGESLATMEMFLLLSTILQTFNILPADPENVPPLKFELGLTRKAAPYEIKLVERRA